MDNLQKLFNTQKKRVTSNKNSILNNVISSISNKRFTLFRFKHSMIEFNLIIVSKLTKFITNKNLVYQIINAIDLYLTKKLVYKFGSNTLKSLKSQVCSLELIKIKIINE